MKLNSARALIWSILIIDPLIFMFFKFLDVIYSKLYMCCFKIHLPVQYQEHNLFDVI